MKGGYRVHFLFEPKSLPEPRIEPNLTDVSTSAAKGGGDWTHLLHSALNGIIQLSAGTHRTLEPREPRFLQTPPGRTWTWTHWKSACFSLKTRTQKSPLLLGSKVDGTIRYSPGGSEKRLHTSRRLMKVSERAAEAWRRKKFWFRWTFLWPRY